LPEDYERMSRLERRREGEAARTHLRRNISITVSVSVILLVVLSLGGWIVYTRVKAGRKPAYKAYAVTLPEGLTNKETAGRFDTATRGSINTVEFERALKARGFDYSFLNGTGGNLEGFLFPNTYDVTSQTSAHAAIDVLLKEFEKKTDDLEWSRAASRGVTPYQIVIIASIIEKEVKYSQERPVVASVIYNRLKKNMKLGMCSTVIYALGQWKPKLSNKDLEVDSPYNTYRISGLPPAPICNPGFESIRAALYPANTDYVYFLVTSSDGHQSFTADYKQFEAWKAQQNKKQQ
jgi:UPF0755 protein